MDLCILGILKLCLMPERNNQRNMKTIIVFFFLVFSGLNLLGQDSYRLKRVVVRYDHGEKNIREKYYVIRPPLYFTFRPQERTKHGLYQSFLFNGNISEKRKYKLGEVLWYQRFDHQGRVREEHADSTGITIHREFHNRYLLQRRQFKNGLKHGTWITNSRVFLNKKTEEYDNGELVSAILKEFTEFEKHEHFSFSALTITDLITGDVNYSVFAPPLYATMRFPDELMAIGENVSICVEITEYENCNHTYALTNSIGPETDRVTMDMFDEYTSVLSDFKERHNIECKNESYPICVFFKFY
ncbi:MAG: hypothetical protein EA361_19370 [Bacteroidetes bacterium]|nr:MAG: hypothetical protein EA361_19370 [Bacteroidota bacterium]